MGKSAVIKFRTGLEPTPKTVGIIIDLEDTDFHSLHDWTNSDVAGIYKLCKNANEELNAAAKGKVLLIDRSGKIPQVICFQANGKTGEPAWCCNSYAAAAAYLHSKWSGTEFSVLNNSVLSVSANVNSIGGGDFSVGQHWEIEKRFVLNHSFRLFRHRAIYLQFLNNYRVIVVRKIEDFEACLERIAKQISSLRLTDKIYLFHPQSGKVRFLTASYSHGAAPITGLCSLAFLKLKVGWLAEKMTGNMVVTPRGEEQLPEMNIQGDKISININNIIVNLKNT